MSLTSQNIMGKVFSRLLIENGILDTNKLQSSNNELFVFLQAKTSISVFNSMMQTRLQCKKNVCVRMIASNLRRPSAQPSPSYVQILQILTYTMILERFQLCISDTFQYIFLGKWSVEPLSGLFVYNLRQCLNMNISKTVKDKSLKCYLVCSAQVWQRRQVRAVTDDCRSLYISGDGGDGGDVSVQWRS